MSYGLREKVLEDRVRELVKLVEKNNNIIKSLKGQYTDVDKVIEKNEMVLEALNARK